MISRGELPSNIILDLNTIFEESYKLFNENILDREKRPMLLGRTIYIDEKNLYDGKANGFWHCSTMGEDDTKFDQDPCENDKTKKYCKYRCNINHSDNFLVDKKRVPCIYRADKLLWLSKIIELVNNKELDNIKVWKCKNRDKSKDLKIWYDDGDISYIIIFKISYNEDKNDIKKYVLKTAYPVVLKSYRRRFQREYNENKFEIK